MPASTPRSAGASRSTYEAAAAGELAWDENPEGALALVIVLDQFPRNMFRNNARTFAADPLAREVASRAIARGFDQLVPLAERMFFYLPFEHSEKLADQERCVALNRAGGDAEAIKWAELTPTSFAGSAASRTATPCSAAPPRRKSRPFSTAAGLRDSEGPIHSKHLPDGRLTS